ncbi:hypothetical protein ABPG74_012976 [Tetrahymena malaccensis]
MDQSINQQNWESLLVQQLFNNEILDFIDNGLNRKPQNLLYLLFKLMQSLKMNKQHEQNHLQEQISDSKLIHVEDENDDQMLEKFLKNTITTYDQNIQTIVNCQELVKTKEEQYKYLVRLDDQIKQNCLKLEFSQESQLYEFHQQYVNGQWKNYNLISFYVFISLGKSKIWPRLFKEIKSGKKVERQWQIHQFFDQFRNDFSSIVKQGFNSSVISKKHQKEIDKQTIIQKSNNSFIQAVRENLFEKVQQMLVDGTNIEAIDTVEQYTAAHIACDVGNMEMIRLLDSYKCNWEALDHEQMTPLYYAIRGENLPVVKFLVEEKKVNVEHKEFMHRTPFYWACCLGNLRIIRFLTEAGADINAKTKLMRTALNKACFLGRADVVSYLLSQPQIDFEWGDTKGRNPLHNAIFGPRGGREGKKVGTFGKDCPEAALLLLEKGVNVDAEDVDQSTPLHIACSSEALDSIPLLIAYGADVNKQNKFGDTALHFASRFGHIKTVIMLIEQFNALVLEDCKGFTGLDNALLGNHLDIYTYLIEKIAKEYIQTPDQKYRHLKNLIKQYENKTQKLYLQLFLNNVVCSDDYQYFFSNEIIEMLPLLRDVDMFDLLSQKFKSFFVQEDQIINLLLIVIKSRKIDFFNKLFESFIDVFQKFEFNNVNEILHNILEYNDREIVQIAFTLNLNIFDYRNQNQTNNSFLHDLVQRRKTGVIINFIKVINNKYPQSQLKNKFLIEKQGDLEFMKKFVLMKNDVNMNCIEQAVILKFFDIYNLLEQFCVKNLNFDKQLVEFQIPEYDIVAVEDYLKQLKDKVSENVYMQEKEHICYLIEPEMKYNLNRSLLEQIIQEVDQTKKVQIYELNNQNDSQFYKEINSIPFEQKPQYLKNKMNSLSSIFVDKEEQLIEKVIPDLLQHQIIGIDLEYWTDNKDQKLSYICTLQLSTLTSNFVIDTLNLRKQVSIHLKSIFESAKFVKVFHGGETDLKLLKKDLNFNLVNIFDTAKAYLKQNKGAGSVSLSSLSQQYLNYNVDKQYQTSDWRIRPLPKPMLNYAMYDSFITLILFFVMKSTISQEELCIIAISCNKMCIKQLEKSSFDFNKLFLIKDNQNIY